jgi:hypothetical protein
MVYLSVQPWLTKVEFVSCDQCRSVFAPLFSIWTNISISHSIINKFMQPFFRNYFFLQTIVEHLPWGPQAWMQLLTLTPDPNFVIQWMIMVLLKTGAPTHISVLAQCFSQTPGFLRDPASIPVFLYLVQSNPLLRDDTMVRSLALKLVRSRNLDIAPSKPFDLKPHVGALDPAVACAFAVCTRDPAQFRELMCYVPADAIRRDPDGFVRSICFAALCQHPCLGDLFGRFFAADIPAVAEVAAICLRTDSEPLCRLALPHAAGNVDAIVDCVTRGMLPLEVLATVSKARHGNRFWVNAAKGKSSKNPPTTQSVISAVRFGGPDLIRAVADAIPDQIAPDVVVPYLFYNFQNTWPIMEKIPPEMLRHIPRPGAVASGIATSSDLFAHQLLSANLH